MKEDSFLSGLVSEGWKQLGQDLLGYIIIIKEKQIAIVTKGYGKFVQEPLDILQQTEIDIFIPEVTNQILEE